MFKFMREIHAKLWTEIHWKGGLYLMSLGSRRRNDELMALGAAFRDSRNLAYIERQVNSEKLLSKPLVFTPDWFRKNLEENKKYLQFLMSIQLEYLNKWHKEKYLTNFYREMIKPGACSSTPNKEIN